MSDAEQLAVVVPFYNEERTLPETLHALQMQEDAGDFEVYLVDNNPTDTADRSVDIIKRFTQEYPNLPVSIVPEPEKGTGAAADTGFRAAIHNGATIVARTDADTQPRPDWVHNIRQHMQSRPELQSLGGVSHPSHDHYHRSIDQVLWRPSIATGRVAMAAVHRSLWPLKHAVGHNMATRAEAYEAVDGFPRTSINAVDEDQVYGKRIYQKYGFSSMALERDVAVDTSMRRVQTVGYMGLLAYWMHDDNTAYRLRATGGNIDIR